MKAYKVSYRAPGKSNSVVVLAEREEELEQSLSQKDKSYKIGNSYCEIESRQEIPLSTVMLSELSVGEFMKLMKNNVK